MAILKCKMCAGELSVQDGSSIAVCEYCGSKQTVPSIDSEKKLTLFSRANRLRYACEFDKAAGVYESIVSEFPEESEAYWGLVLCTYGIEYVDDPATSNKIPTCHRTSFESVMDNSNFEQALENADVTARSVYREEAKQIETLRKNIIEVSSKEEPYDIFICYKETDENGERTLDSVLAQDIYEELVKKGYRVFFSRITLEDKLGKEYEPYIFSALNSAKVMLVFGTNYEYFNAVWVKNEWSRFLQLISAGQKKTLIPCYKGIDAYDMPREFAKLQAQDLGKVGESQDLIRGIDKLISIESTNKSHQENDYTSSLKRAFMFLEDGEFADARTYCEKVLDIDPYCAVAYLYKPMAEKKAKTIDELCRCAGVSSDRLFAKALSYADENLKEELNAISKDADKIYKMRCDAVRSAARIQSTIFSASSYHVAGVCSDGTVWAVGNTDGRVCRECNVSSWRNIVAVSAGSGFTVGVKADGRVVVTEGATFTDYKVMPCAHYSFDLSQWTDIVAVSSNSHIVGLRSDGTVVAQGLNRYGQCNVSGWRDIVAIATAYERTVGLKADGTVLTTGNNRYGDYNTQSWKDIVAIATTTDNILGLKSDGTVVCTSGSDNYFGQCNVSKWTDIVAISSNGWTSYGVKSDGTVVATKHNVSGESNVYNWKDVVALAPMGQQQVHTTFCVKKDGSIESVGSSFYGINNALNKRLFSSFETWEDEFENYKAKAKVAAVEEARILQQKAKYRRQNLCQHCGGTFKGIFTKKCANCGREKDY